MIASQEDLAGAGGSHSGSLDADGKQEIGALSNRQGENKTPLFRKLRSCSYWVSSSKHLHITALHIRQFKGAVMAVFHALDLCE